MAYSVKRLADKWDLSPKVIYGMIERGELRAFRAGSKLLRISEEEIQRCESQPIEPTALDSTDLDGSTNSSASPGGRDHAADVVDSTLR